MIEVRYKSNSTTCIELHATWLIFEGVMDDVVEPAAEDFQLPRVLAALAEPNRLATVRYVARSGESCCSEIIQEAGLAMTKSTFSHHLRILREAGVLTKRIQGTKGYTTLRKADLDDRFPGLIDAVIDAENQVPSLERTRDSVSSVAQPPPA
jgi:DNA-binding transcriptional ArsR family regulator